ncbi:hypothetical protein Ae201684_007262, partial [Aphanomyces euteiches]
VWPPKRQLIFLQDAQHDAIVLLLPRRSLLPLCLLDVHQPPHAQEGRRSPYVVRVPQSQSQFDPKGLRDETPAKTQAAREGTTTPTHSQDGLRSHASRSQGCQRYVQQRRRYSPIRAVASRRPTAHTEPRRLRAASCHHEL